MSDVEVVQNPFDAVPGASRSAAEGAGARAVQARESAEVMALVRISGQRGRHFRMIVDAVSA